MAKLTSEEFNNKYAEKIVDNDDLLIELMEDFADSVSIDNSVELDSMKVELENAKEELKKAKERYKQRFLSAVSEEIKEENIEENIDEPSEEEIIDIKEI